MPDSDLSKSTTIDELMAMLDADPTFVKRDMDESETSITFLSKGAADRAKAAQEKMQP